MIEAAPDDGCHVSAGEILIPAGRRGTSQSNPIHLSTFSRQSCYGRNPRPGLGCRWRAVKERSARDEESHFASTGFSRPLTGCTRSKGRARPGAPAQLAAAAVSGLLPAGSELRCCPAVQLARTDSAGPTPMGAPARQPRAPRAQGTAANQDMADISFCLIFPVHKAGGIPDRVLALELPPSIRLCSPHIKA